MKKTTGLITLLALLLFSAPSSWAATKLGDIGIELNGFYRIRSQIFDFADEEFNQVDFTDHRLRLEASWQFHDKVKLVTEISALENVVWGDNSETGNILSQTTTDEAHDLPFVLNTSSDYQEVDTIRLKRLYLQVMTPIGILRAGRMGSHWGMGLLSNSGDDIEDLRGDTYDRILFLTGGEKLNNFYLSALFSQVVEGDTTLESDDVREIVVAPFWTPDIKTRDKFAGVYLLYRYTYKHNNLSADGRAYLADFYFSWKFTEELKVRFELLYGQADFVMNLEPLLAGRFNTISYDEAPAGANRLDVSGSALNFALALDYETESWYFRGRGAGQTGADEQQVGFGISPYPNFANPAAPLTQAHVYGDTYTLAFDADVKYDLIMFQEAYNALTELTPLPFDDSNGSLYNAWLIKLQGGYKFTVKDDFDFDISLSAIYGGVVETDAWAVNAYAFGNTTSTPSAVYKPEADDLGFEVDLEFYITMYERFRFGILAGYFSAGGFFDDMNKLMDPSNTNAMFTPYFWINQNGGFKPFTADDIYTFQLRFYVMI